MIEIKFQHTDIVGGKWNTLSIFEQMANIGAEVGRAIRWKKKSDEKYATNALWRALELIDLTIADPKNRGRLGELTKMREALCSHFVAENEYCTIDESWERYFDPFAYAAAMERHKNSF